MLLLVLDRLDDPVTPLLSQWTYQAMVHELLGIRNNVVDLRALPKPVAKENQELVLSAGQDHFFSQYQYANFGELGAAVKAMVDEFQARCRSPTPPHAHTGGRFAPARSRVAWRSA